MNLPGRGGSMMDVLRRAFTDHLGLKLLSIAAAIVLFSLVRGAEDAQRSMFVDVVALLPQADSGKILISELPDRVKLTLQGSRSLLNSIGREELGLVQVDLTDPDLRYYYFEPTAFEIPAGVAVVQLAPASIPLTWADRIERRLHVSTELVGVPGDGLSVQQPIQIEPETILLRGAQNEIERLNAVLTEPIDVTGLGAGRHERRVRLSSPPLHATYDGGGSVRVLLEIVPEVEQRTFADVAVEVIGPQGRVRPDTVVVVLEGPPAALAELRAARVVPYVDASDPNIVGTVPAQVQVQGVPEEFSVRRIEPAEVLLTVTRRPGGPP